MNILDEFELARWITKNGRHININTSRKRKRRSYSSNYTYSKSQRERIQRELDELRFRKESEMAKKALRESVSFLIRHIVPMIGPIISDVIKLTDLEREHKGVEEQIRLIDSIKHEVDILFESKTTDPEHKEKATLIRNTYQEIFVNTSGPSRGRKFLKALFYPTIFKVIKGEFQTGHDFVEEYGITERLSESNVGFLADRGADRVVDCLIKYLNEKISTLESTEKLEILSASLLEYCLKLQENIDN